MNMNMKELFQVRHPLMGLEKEESEHEKRFGRPFSYHSCRDPDYPLIPFGYLYQIRSFPSVLNNETCHVLFMILSPPPHQQQRALIRKHYQRHLRVFNMSYFFVMGCDKKTNVSKESQQYADILQLDHVDCYHNLSLAVLNALQSIYDSQISFDFLVKTDDDCVININSLFSIVDANHLKRIKFLYLGNCYNRGVYETHNRSSSHYIPSELVSIDRFIPNYATGAAYVLSSPLIPPLLLESRYLPFLTHQEDVSVGRAIHRAGLTCIAPRPGLWVARNGCIDPVTCHSFVVVHVSSDVKELERVYDFF